MSRDSDIGAIILSFLNFSGEEMARCQLLLNNVDTINEKKNNKYVTVKN